MTTTTTATSHFDDSQPVSHSIVGFPPLDAQTAAEPMLPERTFNNVSSPTSQLGAPSSSLPGAPTHRKRSGDDKNREKQKRKRLKQKQARLSEKSEGLQSLHSRCDPAGTFQLCTSLFDRLFDFVIFWHCRCHGLTGHAATCRVADANGRSTKDLKCVLRSKLEKIFSQSVLEREISIYGIIILLDNCICEFTNGRQECNSSHGNYVARLDPTFLQRASSHRESLQSFV